MSMRRVQIYLPEAVDDSLAAQAVRRGVSKAALIRQAVDREIEPTPAVADGWQAMVGMFDSGPGEDIDEVIYGPST